MTFIRYEISLLPFSKRLALTLLLSFSFNSLGNAQYKVIAFDAFPIFDPRPVFATTKKLFPKKGKALNKLWVNKQFSYTWLRVSGNKYKDFFKVTEDALIYAAKSVGIPLTTPQKNLIMNTYYKLLPWPEATAALKKLKQAGIKLTFLSNFTEKMLNSAIKNSQLQDYFSPLLSTDLIKTFKPDPKAYQLVIDRFKVKKSEILFVPFAAWDAAGAKWFGHNVFWVNRLGQQREELGISLKNMGTSLNDLVDFVLPK